MEDKLLNEKTRTYSIVVELSVGNQSTEQNDEKNDPEMRKFVMN